MSSVDSFSLIRSLSLVIATALHMLSLASPSIRYHHSWTMLDQNESVMEATATYLSPPPDENARRMGGKIVAPKFRKEQQAHDEYASADGYFKQVYS